MEAWTRPTRILLVTDLTDLQRTLPVTIGQAKSYGAEILLVIRLGNPEPHILVAKIFGIKMPRIGKDRCEAICQASNQNQTKIKRTLLCNLKSITPTLTTQKKQNPPS